jgi:hypothetical protein
MNRNTMLAMIQILIGGGMIVLIGGIIKLCIMITEGEFRNYQRI